jgi:hypothetical protein
MKNLFFLIIMGFLTVSCADKEIDCCVNIDTGISVKYLNEKGQNLFELGSEGYEESEINVYHKVNGQWVAYYRHNLDDPKGIRLDEREDGTYLVIFPSTEIVERNYSETKIEFSDSDSDIIKAEIDQSGPNTVVTRVWYNGVLKWEAYETERMFEVLK